MASDGIKRTRKAGGRKRQALLRASIEEGPNYLLAPLQRFHVLTLDAGGRRDWAETSWWVGSASNLSRTRRGGGTTAGGRRRMVACSPVWFRWCPRGDSNTRPAV